MIYEFRTYDLKPHSRPEVEKRCGEAYETRKTFSQLAAFWHTEIGPLNQIIHIWPYKTLGEGWAMRNKRRETGEWPPSVAARRQGCPTTIWSCRRTRSSCPALFRRFNRDGNTHE